MKLFPTVLPLLILFVTACNSNKTTQETSTGDSVALAGETANEAPLYIQMAVSDIQRNPDPRLLDFRPKPKWEYTNGLVATAMLKVWEETGDERFFNYPKYYADSMVNEDGSIETYKKEDYNIDRINPGKFLIDLYKETGEDSYRLAIENLRDQMRKHPRTEEGGFWHKKIYPHQMWLDGLYHGVFLAQYAKEFNEPELLNDVANQFYLINKYTWDEEDKVFYHGWDESREQKWADPETGLSPHVWGRAMGWLAMACVDALDYFPENHPERGKVMTVVNNMAEAVKKWQDEETGVWYQVVNLPDREGNYLESSASSMFVYFLAKAVEKGHLDEEYMTVAEKGYEGILKEFIKENEDGTISITNVCSVAGLGGNPYRDGSYEYYISEPQRDNDPKAVGPFIMASLLFEKKE